MISKNLLAVLHVIALGLLCFMTTNAMEKPFLVAQLQDNIKTGRMRKKWDISFFEDQNLPVVVGMLKDQQKFSSHYQNKLFRLQNLPIHTPDQGWCIPDQLEQFHEVIGLAIASEKECVPDFEKDHYVHLTVHQGAVEPHKQQRSSVWHSDSFRLVCENSEREVLGDHNYIVYDNCPTLFVPGPFFLKNVNIQNLDAVFSAFAKVALKRNVVTYPNYTLLRLDPYCVHDAGINEQDVPKDRTFVRITFSTVKLIDISAAVNNALVCDWSTIPCKTIPYAPSLGFLEHKGISFFEINVLNGDDILNKIVPPLFEGKMSNIKKRAPVEMCIVNTDEVREIKVGKFKNYTNLVSLGCAGDYKIKLRIDCWVYVSAHTINILYAQDPGNAHHYFPKRGAYRAMVVAQPVMISNHSLGIIQYAMPGDYIIYINKVGIYALSKAHFYDEFAVVEYSQE